MNDSALISSIKAILKEKNGIWLAHNYQREEIQAAADLTGDSLELSQAAARTAADLILFCGVHFMAESAAILSPQKRVLLPRLDAGCPMADMITAEQLVAKKKELPDYTVVTYVNSSAAVKAESDICCTSGNALRVVDAAPGDKIFFIPDQNLAKWVAAHTIKLVKYWPGFCPTHHRLHAQHLLAARKRHPDALVIVHPECRPDVTALADVVASTAGMLAWAKTTAAKKVLVGTEIGLLYQLRKQNPDVEFISIDEDLLVCPNMKLTGLEDVLEALESPDRFTVTVDEKIRIKARACLERMLQIPRN